MDGLTTAAANEADVVLVTELGTTAKTQPLLGTSFVSDWGAGKYSRYGEAVRDLFDQRWNGS